MEQEWIEHIGLGAGLALMAAIALLFMVYRELAPVGGLNGRGRLLLTAGVGLGVLSFAAKVAALAVMTAAPQATLLPLTALREVARTPSGPRRERPLQPLVKPGHVWEALPEAGAEKPEWVALGRRLFHDRSLSLDRSVACASCHDVDAGAGSDGLPVSRGIGGQRGRRNAPTVWNTAFQARLFWDGRAASLEEQAKGPPVNPVEMGMHSLDDVVARVAAEPGYRTDFAALLGAGRAIGIDDVAAAIAAWERTLITPDAPYDQYVRGDADALDPAQKRGMALFESVGCVACHYGPNFSSASRFDARAPYRLFPAYGNTYVARYRLDADGGRITSGSRGVWRVPSLRNVALTAPYFHNGAVNSLEEAVRVMAVSQLGRRIVSASQEHARAVLSNADGRLHRVETLEISKAEIRDIAAFLRALTSERLRARVDRRRQGGTEERT